MHLEVFMFEQQLPFAQLAARGLYGGACTTVDVAPHPASGGQHAGSTRVLKIVVRLAG